MTAPIAAFLLLAAVAVALQGDRSCAVQVVLVIDNARTNAAIRKDCADTGCGCLEVEG